MASVALAAPSPVSVGSAPGYSGNPGGSASQIVPQSVMVCRTAGDGGGDDCADAAEVGVLTLASWVAPGDDTLGDGTGVDETELPQPAPNSAVATTANGRIRCRASRSRRVLEGQRKGGILDTATSR